VARKRVDLAPGQLDLAVEVTDQAEQAVEPPAGGFPEWELGQGASACAEEVGTAAWDLVAGGRACTRF